MIDYEALGSVVDQDVFLYLGVKRATSSFVPLPGTPGASPIIFRTPRNIRIGKKMNPGCLSLFFIILKQPGTCLGNKPVFQGTQSKICE